MSDPKDRSKGGTESVRDGATRLEDFRLMCKLGEGTFSEVLKVKHKKSGRIYAMKRFRKTFSTFEEVEGLREIQALRRLNPHQHIIDLEDVVFEPKHGILSLNFELMDCNLYELISKKQVNITEQRAKGYMLQICRGLEYMHSKGIFHRDIKPENILIKDHTIKIADFGSCRGIHSKPPYTEYIATRWYRAPECLLCDGMYSYKMDLWAVGCVLYELITGAPLFPGINEVDQIHRIHNVLGTPSQKVLKSMMG
ncbi:kinase-like domain-containing protein [Zopfochytrium polystomum]|nr:kinase-like domain-containing protein [Zopfochytrium polystomum]